MIAFLSENVANIVIGGAIAVVVALVIAYLIKKNKGRSGGCGCCDGCAKSTECRKH